jgi:hypothetical protein
MHEASAAGGLPGTRLQRGYSRREYPHATSNPRNRVKRTIVTPHNLIHTLVRRWRNRCSTPGGTKYHARGVGGGWIAGHEATTGIFTENFLCVQDREYPHATSNPRNRVKRTIVTPHNLIHTLVRRLGMSIAQRLALISSLVRSSSRVFHLEIAIVSRVEAAD